MKKEIGAREITKQIEVNFEEQVKFLSSLVKEASINDDCGNENGPVEFGVARLIRGQLRKMGVMAKYFRAKKSRPNVVAVWGNVRARKSLALVGHMDTSKPLFGDREEWFSGQVSSGKLYGAGALDMKGTLSAYVFALKALLDLGIQPAGQLKLAFTVDAKREKPSELGLKFLTKKGFRASGAILGKLGTDKIAIGHRGGYRFKMVTQGEAVNTGRRAWEEGRKGKNAILSMAKIIRKLSHFDLPYRPAKAFPGRVPVFTFPTKILGGKSVDMVPDLCEAWGDVRLLPGNTDMQVKIWIEEKLLGMSDIVYELVDELYVPPMEIEKTNKLVQMLLEQASEVLGKKPRLEGCGPWNDAWMLTCLADTPCIAGFGPDGSEWTSVDEREWVDLSSLKKVTEVYARTVWQYLGDISAK
jgi:acetylornithine deacetylase/succinyl-diaminopimelate desuccinylase-like protein